MRKGLRILFRELRKTGSHPGLNWGPLTLVVSALRPELWPPGDSQPSQLSISLRMCRQNPVRDRPVTPLHQGRSHTEWNTLYIHSSAHEAGSPSREPPNTTCKLRYTCTCASVLVCTCITADTTQLENKVSAPENISALSSCHSLKCLQITWI